MLPKATARDWQHSSQCSDSVCSANLLYQRGEPHCHYSSQSNDNVAFPPPLPDNPRYQSRAPQTSSIRANVATTFARPTCATKRERYTVSIQASAMTMFFRPTLASKGQRYRLAVFKPIDVCSANPRYQRGEAHTGSIQANVMTMFARPNLVTKCDQRGEPHWHCLSQYVFARPTLATEGERHTGSI